MHWKSLVFCISAVIFTIESIYVTVKGNFTTGVVLIYMITAALWIYGLFNKQIDIFCSHGIGYWAKILFFCGIAFLCFMLAFVALSGKTPAAKGDEKAIIVLGAGLRGDTVSEVLKNRLDAAYSVHLKAPTAIIVVSGGQGQDELVAEAVAMKKYLVAKGVPPELIIEESKSTSTKENFLFSQKLLEERGIKPSDAIAFSTNDFHCYRAGKQAEKIGYTNMRVISAPTGFSALIKCYLREVLAVMHLWVFVR